MSKLLFVPVAITFAIFAIANRDPVVIDLWPLPQSLDLPLYVAVFGAALCGFLVGALATWYGAIARRMRARRAVRPEVRPQPALAMQPQPDPRPPIMARYRAAADEA